MAACKESDSKRHHSFYHEKAEDGVEKLEIVKYIVEKVGFEQLDLKAVCQQACSSKKIKILEWFVQNIDTIRLDVYSIIDSALVCKRSGILEHIMKNIELESLDKRSVLKSVTEHFTAGCSTTILEIVHTIWDSTKDKEVLHMEEIVDTAYERRCFELLMWIHKNCHPHTSIDSKKVLVLACKVCRVDVAKWVVQTFEHTSLDIDGVTLLMITCSKRFDCKYRILLRKKHRIKVVNKIIGTVNWILATFQIKRLDIISGVLKLLSVKHTIRNELFNLVVSILEKYMSCLKTEDMQEIINKSLEQKSYVLVNWFLEKRSSYSLDKQTILNKACTDAKIETIKILSKYFYALDMNQAMINACTSSRYHLYSFEQRYFNCDQSVACLSLLWKEIGKIDLDSIDIRTIVNTVCKEKNVSNNVMTWILLNLPHDQIPINELLITCCQQRKIQHVKYIFHKVDNEQLDILDAFVQACRPVPYDQRISFYKKTCLAEGRMLVDYLFQKLHDKESNLSLVLNELFEKKKIDLILYFLQAGYCRHIEMKSLLKEACRHGYVRLVHWILGNVEHKELDIKSAFHEACDGIIHDYLSFSEQNRVKCLALMWHYIHDISTFEIDTVLKTMAESKSHTSWLRARYISYPVANLKTWLLYIKDIYQRICQSDNALLNTEENINQQSQQVHDGQCCLEDLQDNDDLNSSNDHDDGPSPMKKLRLENKEQT